MNAKERLFARIKGQPVERIPNLNMFTTYAARYIGQPLSSYYLDYRVLSEANLAVLLAFQVDLVQVVSDPYREAADFGAEVLFPEDKPPLYLHPLLAEPADLLKIKPPAPYTGRRMSDRLMAVRYLSEQVGKETPVLGWVEGPLSEAAILRSLELLLVDLYERPKWVHELLEICTQVALEFARLQVAMGADIIGIGESLASQLSPALYRQFALPYQQRIIATVHELGALARLYSCGNTTHLLNDLLDSGAEIIDVPAQVDLETASQLFAGRAAPCGNIDAVSAFLLGSPQDVRRETRRAIRQGGALLLCAASGEILDGTPEENLHAQAEVLAEDKPA